MHSEDYYSRKIKDLQNKKNKAHTKHMTNVYNKVGHYFVQTESKKDISEHNYDQFTYIDKDTFNELKEVANTMIYENGYWSLHLHNANNFYTWFAKNFRNDQGKKPHSNNDSNHEQNNSPNDNSDSQSNKAPTNNLDDRKGNDNSSSQDNTDEQLNFLNHYNNENH